MLCAVCNFMLLEVQAMVGICLGYREDICHSSIYVCQHFEPQDSESKVGRTLPVANCVGSWYTALTLSM